MLTSAGFLALALLVTPPAFGVDVFLRRKRVINGDPLEAGAWPSLVSLQSRRLQIFPFPMRTIFTTCGGSLLGDRFVLTAAHCFDSERSRTLQNPNHWHVRLGDTDLTPSWLDRILGWTGRTLEIDQLAARNWQVHAEKIIIHPGYRAGSKALWKNDIALIKLDRPVPSGANVPQIRRVNLPSVDSGFPEDGDNCVAMGWGCTELGGGAVSPIARKVTIPKMEDAVCGLFWNIDTNSRLCAGASHSNNGICSGDSGGPLMCLDRKQGRWVQAGIASFGLKDRGGVAVFTRVSHYLKWITETTTNHTSSH